MHLSQTLRDNVFTFEDVIVEVGSKPGYVVVDGDSIRVSNKYNKMVNKADVIEKKTIIVLQKEKHK